MDYKIDVVGAEVTHYEGPEKPYNPLNRPKISYKKPIILFAVFCAIVTGICFIPVTVLYKLIIIGVFSLIYIGIILKKAIIWLVHLYQNKASDQVRLRCVFEPSCSEYMIMAVEKYGAVRGVFKGIKRLLRCHAPNGGKDYP